MPSWNWDEEASGSGVVHQNTANTDHTDATGIKQGYDYANFSEITPTPVACWPQHEDSGTTANDLAGTFDATYNGPTLGQTGLLGTTAPSYDGTDDETTRADETAFRTPPFTVSVWAYLGDPTGNRRVFSTIISTDNQNWELAYRGDQNVGMRFIVGEGSFTLAEEGSNEAEGWHLYTGTLDGSASGSELQLFVDGALADSNTLGSSYTTSSQTLTIGNSSAGFGNPWQGRIADARIYDSVLTSSEIQALYDVVDTTGEWVGNGKLL